MFTYLKPGSWLFQLQLSKKKKALNFDVILVQACPHTLGFPI